MPCGGSQQKVAERARTEGQGTTGMVKPLKDHTIGRFWQAGSPEFHLPGSLDLSRTFPTVHLAGQLTPIVRWIDQGNGSWQGEPVDAGFKPPTSHLHGLLADTQDREITLFDSITSSRNYGPMATLGKDAENGSQSLQGIWLVQGAHIDPNEEILGGLLRFTNIDAWIGNNGITIERTGPKNRRRTTLHHTTPYPQTALIPGTGTSVGVSFDRQFATPTRDGVEIHQKTWIQFENLRGQTLPSFFENYVSPMVNFASIMLDQECVVTELLILTRASDNYLPVYHPVIKRDAVPQEIPLGSYYLGLPHISIGSVARWLHRSTTLDPVPNILVATLSASRNQRTVESSLLELAACAEGLDRRMHQDEAVFDPDIADKARRVALEAVKTVTKGEVREEILKRISDSLSHFNEASYSERLNRLIKFTDGCIPEAAGVTRKWTKTVVTARNGYAHLLNEPGNPWEVNLVILESLKWILGAVILIHAGISPATIKERLNKHQPYLNFKAKARELAPDIYVAKDGQNASP